MAWVSADTTSGDLIWNSASGGVRLRWTREECRGTQERITLRKQLRACIPDVEHVTGEGGVRCWAIFLSLRVGGKAIWLTGCSPEQ